MSSMGRNLKHWLFYQAKTAGLTFVMIIGMVSVFAFASGGNFIEKYLEILPLYLGLMATFSIIVNGFTGISVIFPVTVSFGAKRRDSVVAMALSVHVVAVIEYGITFLALYFAKPEIGILLKELWPIFIAVICFVLALGNLVALLSNRFGRVAGMICYAIIILVAVVGIIMGMNLLLGTETFNFNAASVVALGIATIASLVFLALDVLSTYWLYKSVKEKDLTFAS